jgi:ubiquinone/menaquinone biosynthesis C-methylase UbiE
MQRYDEALWNGEQGAGGISWVDRSRMGPLRGVIDAADAAGRRNAYMHALHTLVLERELRAAAPVRRALDFGCGTGRMLETLARFANEVHAVDREPEMVAAARRYGGAYVNRIECWQNGKVPFETAAFDFALCSSVLCVTASDLIDASLDEIARMTQVHAPLLLLEQVAPARGLSLQRYFTALRDAGFEPQRAYAIRAASSRFTRFAGSAAYMSPLLYRLFARLELTHVARRPRITDAYVEYAIVSRRR